MCSLDELTEKEHSHNYDTKLKQLNNYNSEDIIDSYSGY